MKMKKRPYEKPDRVRKDQRTKGKSAKGKGLIRPFRYKVPANAREIDQDDLMSKEGYEPTMGDMIRAAHDAGGEVHFSFSPIADEANIKNMIVDAFADWVKSEPVTDSSSCTPTDLDRVAACAECCARLFLQRAGILRKVSLVTRDNERVAEMAKKVHTAKGPVEAKV